MIFCWILETYITLEIYFLDSLMFISNGCLPGTADAGSPVTADAGICQFGIAYD